MREHDISHLDVTITIRGNSNSEDWIRIRTAQLAGHLDTYIATGTIQSISKNCTEHTFEAVIQTKHIRKLSPITFKEGE